MNEPYNDDCITVRVIDACHGRLDGIASVFIKREGRDPTLRELNHEANTAQTAERREYNGKASFRGDRHTTYLGRCLERIVFATRQL